MTRKNQVLYKSIMESLQEPIRKMVILQIRRQALNESNNVVDEYDKLYDDFSRKEVRRLALEYLKLYNREFPEEFEEKNINWGEIEVEHINDLPIVQRWGVKFTEDLQNAWMDGENWAADIADQVARDYWNTLFKFPQR